MDTDKLFKSTKKPDFYHEDALGTGHVVGTDEVGYGAWAGPIVVAAAWIDRHCVAKDFLNQLNDSKCLTAQKRNTIFDAFVQNPSWGCYAIASVDVPDIQQGLVLKYTLEAMVQAVKKLPKITGILVDGRYSLPFDCPQKAIPGGDAQSYSIALASILAKVTRDRLMQDLSEEYPFFGWAQNKGYGTKSHQQAIAEHGLSIHHRPFIANVFQQHSF